MARNATLDHARLWAAFGIVLFHAGGPGGAIGYAGLPFFTMMLVLLAWPAAGSQPVEHYAATRSARLLTPWVLWSVVYGALKLAEVAMTGRPLASEFAPEMLLTGTAIHLWFLPFAFVVSLALVPVARLRLPVPRAAVLALIGALTLAGFAPGQGAALPVPVAQWAFVLPAAVFGLAFVGVGRGAGAGNKTDLAVVAGLATAVVGAAWGLGATEGLLQFALAAGALVACLALPRPETALSRLAAELALGVYLCHRLVLSLLDRLTPLEPGSAGMALAAILGALVLAFGLHLAGLALMRPRGMRAAA